MFRLVFKPAKLLSKMQTLREVTLLTASLWEALSMIVMQKMLFLQDAIWRERERWILICRIAISKKWSSKRDNSTNAIYQTGKFIFSKTKIANENFDCDQQYLFCGLLCSIFCCLHFVVQSFFWFYQTAIWRMRTWSTAAFRKAILKM